MLLPLRPRVLLASLTCLFGASSIEAQLGVSSVHPAENTVSASTATNVTIQFDADVDAATVTPLSFMVYGRWSGVRNGTTAVTGDTVTWRPDLPFFPGESVMIMLSSAVQDTGGAALANGYASHFWTKANRTGNNFVLEGVLSTRLPGEGLVQSYGIYAGDLDRDGSPDFSIPNEAANDVRVMRNDGCGSYTTPELHPLPLGSVPSANEGADFDLDGYIDLVTANIGGDSVSVLMGDGAGSYQPATTYPSGNAARGVTVLDYDADGDTDFAVALRSESRVALHENLGGGVFAPANLFEAGVAGETSIITIDANHDGISDLFVGGYDSDEVTCLIGGGGGLFVSSDTESVPGHPWMLAAGDVDGDGDVDAATCCSSAARASIVRSDGTGGLSPSEDYVVGSFPLAIDLGDVDGDGDLDMIASSFSAGNWTYFQNDGTGSMVAPMTFSATFAGSCMIVVDDDRDGDMDLLAVDEISDQIFLYRNDTPQPAGVQPAACDAALRVNNLASSAGYWLLPAHEVYLGETAFLGISAAPGAAWAIGVGVPLSPGVATGFGLLNLSPAYPLVSGVTDGFGEATAAIALPPSITPGSTAGLQGFTFAGTFTNPEVISITP